MKKISLIYIEHYFNDLKDELMQYDYRGYIKGDENVNNFTSLIQTYISNVENILEAIGDNDKKVSDLEFKKRIEEIFAIDLTPEQFLNMLSEINEKDYVGYTEISTNMGYEARLHEGRGRDFSWWDQKYRIVLNVIYMKDLEIDLEKHYSSSEIKQLIEEKKIVIIDRNGRRVNDIENEEPVISLESCEILDDYGRLDLNKDSKYYSQVLHYVRDNMNIDEVKSGVITYLNSLKNNVKSALKDIQGYEYKDTTISDMSTKSLEGIGYNERVSRVLKKLKL